MITLFTILLSRGPRTTFGTLFVCQKYLREER